MQEMPRSVVKRNEKGSNLPNHCTPSVLAILCRCKNPLSNKGQLDRKSCSLVECAADFNGAVMAVDYGPDQGEAKAQAGL